MLTELLEKFEDLFQPITDEEAVERAPEYTATVTEMDYESGVFLGAPKQYDMKMDKIPEPVGRAVAYAAFIDFLDRRWGISREVYQASAPSVFTILSDNDDYIIEVTVKGKRYRIAIKVK